MSFITVNLLTVVNKLKLNLIKRVQEKQQGVKHQDTLIQKYDTLLNTHLSKYSMESKLFLLYGNKFCNSANKT